MSLVAGVEVSRFEAVPFLPLPERAGVVSYVMRSMANHDPFFGDDCPTCEQKCGACDACQARLAVISYRLTMPDARFWEIWRTNTVDVLPVGVVYLTRVEAGMDALAHHVFFDGRLKGRETILNALCEHWFTERPGWRALRRVTLEIPAYADTLAWHAVKRLGFGGPFFFTRKKGKGDKRIPVEGVRRKAFVKDGVTWDMLILGRLNDLPPPERATETTSEGLGETAGAFVFAGKAA